MTLIDAWCLRCGNHARIPASTLPTATCNNHEAHHHRRGELMTTRTDESKGDE